MKIALISCSKTKERYKCKAKDLYAPSKLFSASYKYAKALNVDKIYILSAKHGLIHEETQIEPYELALKNLPPNRQIDWANYVKKQIENECDTKNVEFIILSGMDYLKPLLDVKAIDNYRFPLKGMKYGERISFMNEEINRFKSCNLKTIEPCDMLHKLFNEQNTFTYQEISEIPFNNGIYIVFEKSEIYKGVNRIVRVGTHTSPNRLKERLRDHYVSENKDGSIFRKNIGKAILNKRKDEYLSIWNKDTSKQLNKQYVDVDIQKSIEGEVSEYLRRNTFFAVVKVEDVTKRLRLENGIIATLNNCRDFQSSNNWLGNYSTEFEIRDSGMWLKKGLNDPLLSTNEMQLIKNTLQNICDHSTYQDKTKLSRENKHDMTQKVTVEKVEEFVKNIIDLARLKGEDEVILVSGTIAKLMKVSHRMPTICSGMRKVMGEKDEILYQPPKGNGTRVKIKYYL